MHPLLLTCPTCDEDLAARGRWCGWCGARVAPVPPAPDRDDGLVRGSAPGRARVPAPAGPRPPATRRRPGRRGGRRGVLGALCLGGAALVVLWSTSPAGPGPTASPAATAPAPAPPSVDLVERWSVGIPEAPGRWSGVVPLGPDHVAVDGVVVDLRSGAVSASGVGSGGDAQGVLAAGGQLVTVDRRTGGVVGRTPVTGGDGWAPAGWATPTPADLLLVAGTPGDRPGLVAPDGGVVWVGERGAGPPTLVGERWAVLAGVTPGPALVVDLTDGTVVRALDGPALRGARPLALVDDRLVLADADGAPVALALPDGAVRAVPPPAAWDGAHADRLLGVEGRGVARVVVGAAPRVELLDPDGLLLGLVRTDVTQLAADAAGVVALVRDRVVVRDWTGRVVWDVPVPAEVLDRRRRGLVLAAGDRQVVVRAGDRLVSLDRDDGRARPVVGLGRVDVVPPWDPALAAAGDGQVLLTGAAGGLRLLDTATGRVVVPDRGGQLLARLHRPDGVAVDVLRRADGLRLHDGARDVDLGAPPGVVPEPRPLLATPSGPVLGTRSTTPGADYGAPGPVVAFGWDGSARWRRDHLWPEAALGEVVVVRDRRDGAAHALDVATGRTRWSRAHLPVAGWAGPLDVAGSSAALAVGPTLRALATDDGEVLWSRRLPALPLGRAGAGVVLLDRVVVVALADGSLLGLAADDAAVRWRTAPMGVLAVAGAGGRVAATTADGRVVVLDADGVVTGRIRLGGGGAAGDVVALGDHVVVVLPDRVVGLGPHVVDRAPGQVVGPP